MIYLSNNTLTIEIATGNYSPLGYLQQLQEGLSDVIGVMAVAKDAPKNELMNALQIIYKLQKEINLSELQADAINESINNNDALKAVFK